MIQAIASFFGMIIRLIFNLVNGNYFLSIILFTLLTKLILFPLTWMQIKSTEKIQKMQPMVKKITEKYKNDKEKQAMELQKLYAENKANPLGGCLPLLIQIPIILAMFAIVRQPLTYITQTPKEEIKTYAVEYLKKEEPTQKEIDNAELVIAKEKNLINMNVGFGINMGDIPANFRSADENKRSNPISLLIPILTVVFSILQMKITSKTSEVSEEQAEMQKSMNFTMPLISGIIAYTMPLALGVYWLFGNILQILQQLFISNKIKRDSKKEVLALDKGGK